MNAAVAFLIYRRPDLTARVFEAIAAARPQRLLIVADGPKDEADRAKCEAARRVTERIDWPCEVLRNYADVNMGCRRRVASGLDWVFGQVEEAIILEDDCLPNATFFPYCQELLARFRDDTRVGHISGWNLGRETGRAEASYRFSLYTTIWGWATWRRAWKAYDVGMKAWPALKADGWHHDIFPSRDEASFFEAYWDDIYQGKIDTWDAQWLLANLMQRQCAVRPNRNLIANIGFRPDGSHATDASQPYAVVPSEAMAFPLDHPSTLVVDRLADERFASAVFPIHRSRWQKTMWWLLNRHSYGRVLRSLPGVGPWWKARRARRSI